MGCESRGGVGKDSRFGTGLERWLPGTGQWVMGSVKWCGLARATGDQEQECVASWE